MTSPLPLLLVGHGSRDAAGRQAVLDLATAYQAYSPERPVIPCFLELTTPTIADGVERCLAEGYQEVVALPVLLFGARHNKFDIPVELDRLQAEHPGLTIHYGSPMGITPNLLDLERERLAALPPADAAETVVVFIGRGSSDPEANAEVCKMARLLYEGSGYKATEVCYIGITHPRLDIGLERARLWQPKRIVVIPYLLFTGVLLQKIERIVAAFAAEHPELDVQLLPELGISEAVLASLSVREQEARLGVSTMNCHLCKFRLMAGSTGSHSHDHGHSHGHAHGHAHDHSHGGHSHAHGGHVHAHDHSHDHGHYEPIDLFPTPESYHERAWQVP